MSKYLALDQALKTTGWAIYDNSNLLTFNSFNIPANKPIEQRLNIFFTKLYELDKEYSFDHVFFEDIQNQANNETYKKLAYVQAAIMIWCYNNDKSFTILSPSHWRKVLKEKYKASFGRNRAEQKKAATSFVKEHFNISNISEDEADSVCIGLAGIAEKGLKESAF